MLTIIAAISEDGFIGKNGGLPWRVKSDTLHFKQVTVSHTVVMGRRTWSSIPSSVRPLPKRRNVIITSQGGFQAPGAEVVLSVDQALSLTENDEQVFIIGGVSIYEQFLPHAERMLLTKIHKEVGDGDARFPVINPMDWNLVSATEVPKGVDDECDCTIMDLSPNLRYLEFANIRTLDQLKNMRQIRQAGHCPFCPEHLPTYHPLPIVKRGKFWVLTPNQYPYPGTEVHLIAIAIPHVEVIEQLPEGAGQELLDMVAEIERQQYLAFGLGLCMRSGNPILSGATVKHLHAQIISPKMGCEPVKFYIGAGKR